MAAGTTPIRAALLRFQECHEPLRKSFNVADFAFPGYECMPALASKRSNRASIPVNIPDSLLVPEFRVGGRNYPTVLAFVHVPEAPVYQYDFSPCREHKVGPSR